MGRCADRRRSPRLLPAFAIVLLSTLLVAALPPGTARAQIGDDLDVERRVRKIIFHGNHTYEDDRLRDLIRTKQKSFWKPWKKTPLRTDFLRADRQTLRQFYIRQGFLYARVESVAVVPVNEKSAVFTLSLWQPIQYLLSTACCVPFPT